MQKIDNLNSLSTKEMQFLVKNLFTSNTPGSDVFTGELSKTFNEAIIPILHKTFRRIEEKKTPSNSFSKASITLVRKMRKVIIKKPQTYILHERDK